MEKPLKVYRALIVTTIVVETESEADAWAVAQQAARCPSPVGNHFTIKQHNPEIKMLAEVKR